MISLYPIGGAPTASRGIFDGVFRLLPVGGGFAGGDGSWEITHYAIGWDFPFSGAVAGGGATYPPRFGYPRAGGIVVGGKAVYPLRWPLPSAGIISGGEAKYPYRLLPVGGSVTGRTQPTEGMTDWRFYIGFPGNVKSGCIASGLSPVVYRLHSDVMLQTTTRPVYLLTRTTTTKSFTMTEVVS